MEKAIYWEYLELNSPTIATLTGAGKSGWELVWSDGTRYLFKRPKK